ncbi:MAG TPA: hypothetical protein PK480_12510, partial [Candidatus Hydrogenedentes bacterium]|nr:hypothetical protein [Candidatus Hydrogenedentota bacterium]
NDEGGGMYDGRKQQWRRGGVDITSEGSNDSVVCRTDGGGMPREVFPQRIRVTVIVMARLCANTETGVPRGAAFSLWCGMDYYPLL